MSSIAATVPLYDHVVHVIVDKNTYLSSNSKAVRLNPTGSDTGELHHIGFALLTPDGTLRCMSKRMCCKQAIVAASSVGKATGAKKLTCVVIDDSAVRLLV